MDLQDACNDADIYPRTLIHSWAYGHELDYYRKTLDRLEDRLFCQEGQAAVDVWELAAKAQSTVEYPSSA